MGEVDFHCGNACPVPDDETCVQLHWCECCGDCMYCYDGECFDGCSTHGLVTHDPTA